MISVVGPENIRTIGDETGRGIINTGRIGRLDGDFVKRVRVSPGDSPIVGITDGVLVRGLTIDGNGTGEGTTQEDGVVTVTGAGYDGRHRKREGLTEGDFPVFDTDRAVDIDGIGFRLRGKRVDSEGRLIIHGIGARYNHLGGGPVGHLVGGDPDHGDGAGDIVDIGPSSEAGPHVLGGHDIHEGGRRGGRGPRSSRGGGSDQGGSVPRPVPVDRDIVGEG